MKKLFFLRAGILAIFITMFFRCDSHPPINENEFQGYWHGLLPANPKVDIILYFYKENEKLAGKAFFTEGVKINNEEPVWNVVLSGKKIEFDLPTQATHYAGKISPTEINGGFYTSGNPFLKFYFKKTELEKLAAVEAIKKANMPFDLNQTYTLSQLKEDFSVLKAALESHPQIYRYDAKDAVDSYFKQAEQKLSDDMKHIDLIRLVAPIIAHLRCSHSQLVLPEKMHRAFITDLKSIPLDIVYLDEKAYIRKNLVDSLLIEAGSEILEINGRSAKEILLQLFECISADGNNLSHKISEINKNFWLFYHYIESPANYVLKIKSPASNKITKVTLAAMPGEKLLKGLTINPPPANEADPNPVPLTLSVNGTQGILSVKSFLYPDLARYREKIATCFKEIKMKQVKNLIVDLRGNTGGHPALAADLFSYFIQKPVSYLKSPDNGHYTELMKPIHPSQNAYHDSVYFLTDGDCLSSTGHLLALIKYHKIGKIVGDIPGGSFSCNDESKLWKLPHSQIQLSVAQINFTAAVEGWKNDTQVIPDFLVKPKIHDILDHKDIILEYVQNLIQIK